MSIDASYDSVSEATSLAPTIESTFSYDNLYAAFQCCYEDCKIVACYKRA